MDTLATIVGINEAIKLLNAARRESASGSLAIWKITDHAEKHLDKQIAELLAV